MFARSDEKGCVVSLKEYLYSLIKENPEIYLTEENWTHLSQYYIDNKNLSLQNYSLENVKNELLVGLSSVRKLVETCVPNGFWTSDTRKLNLSKAGLNMETINKIIHTCHELKEFSINCVLKVNNKIVESLALCCKNIEILNLEGCRMLTDDCVSSLLMMQRLSSLNIGGCFNITRSGITNLLQNHPNRYNFYNIHVTDIDDSILSAITRFCPRIQYLSINFSNFSDQAFIHLIHEMPSLKSLSFDWSKGFTDECLYSIAYGEQLLESLSIVGCDTFSSTGILEMVLARASLLIPNSNIAEQAAKNALQAGYIQTTDPLPKRSLRMLYTKYISFIIIIYSYKKI
ncbi:hypothetical protein WA158_007472 [Blastocystis sp. Blastoise]